MEGQPPHFVVAARTGTGRQRCPQVHKVLMGKVDEAFVKDGQATNPGVENTNGTPVGQWRLAVLKIGSEAGHVRGILADPPCPQLHLALTAPRVRRHRGLRPRPRMEERAVSGEH